MQADATALADAIRVGKLSAREAMQASLDKADELSALGAITYIDSDKGLMAAEAFDRCAPPQSNREDMVFGGVPSLAKDLGGPFEGFPIRAGSRVLRDVDGSADSELAARFRACGLCFFGVTTVPEFGLSLSSEPAIGPMCRNPLNQQLTAGGSSGGAAAAVASGIVAIAHATDAGGSIRVPASCCGLLGLKPSRGAIPGGPTYGNHIGGLASELAVCRSVRDTRAIFHAVAGNTKGPFPPMQSANDEQQKLKIGVLNNTGIKHPTRTEQTKVVLDAAQFLETQGHRIVDVDWLEIAGLADKSSHVFSAIICVNLAQLASQTSFDGAEEVTRAAIARGQAFVATALWKLQNDMVLVSRDLWQLFENYDCLLTPMLSSAPLTLGALPTDHPDIDLHFERMASFSPLATLANVSGFPAITLPFGTDDDGLPLPIQLLAPMGCENRLLDLAAALESEERWTHRFEVAGLCQ